MQSTVSLSPDTLIHYWVYHPHATRTMVLVHGFTGSHAGFQYIIPLLPDIRFIVPDVPGFGESTIANDKWSIEKIACLLNDFTRSLELDSPPILLGHSMGGLIAAAMVAESPKLYARQLILVSPVPTAIRRADSRKGGAVLGTLQYGAGKSLPRLGPKIVKSKRITRLITHLIMTTPEKELQARIHEHHLDNLRYISSVAFYYQIHRDINRRGAIDYADILKQFDLLVIAGTKDTVTPLREQHKLITATDAKLTKISGVGHLAHYEAPSLIAEALSDFLE